MESSLGTIPSMCAVHLRGLVHLAGCSALPAEAVGFLSAASLRADPRLMRASKLLACVGSGIGSGVGSAIGSGVASGVGSGVPIGVGSGVPTGVGSGVPIGVGSGVPIGVGSGVPIGVGSGAASGVGSGVPIGVGSGVGSGADAVAFSQLLGCSQHVGTTPSTQASGHDRSNLVSFRPNLAPAPLQTVPMKCEQVYPCCSD